MPSEKLIEAALKLREDLRPLRFEPPVEYVYQPLDYAWAPHEAYLRRFGASRKKVVFVGMNPGPFGMTQTGVPLAKSRPCAIGWAFASRWANRSASIENGRWSVLTARSPK